MPIDWNDLCSDLLVCPVCQQRLVAESPENPPEFLLCTGCRRKYPVQDGIPVLIADRAVLRTPPE